MRPTHRPLTVAALLLGLFLAAVEMTVVSTAMPTAVGELGGVHVYAWAFASYMLTATVTVPIYGKLADLHGRKPVMLVGIALFLVGSFACGRAGSMEQLIAFRALQGLGAGAIQPIALTIVGDLFDVHQRARMQGLIGAVWGTAGLAGPFVGGAIVKWLSWRWVFYINVPPGLGCAAILWFAYHEKVERHEHRLDAVAAGLLSGAVVLALTAARSRAVAMWAVPASLGALALFLVVERRAQDPILPLDLFSQPVMAVSSALGALIGAAMFSAVTYVPLYVQGALGRTPAQAGAAIAPMVVGWPIASTLGGRILPRVGYRLLIRGGLFLSLAAAVLLALILRPGMSLWPLRALSGLFGLGLGFANPALVIAVQASVPWNRRGIATASTMFFRTIGGTLAVGILGGILGAALAASGAPLSAVDRLLGPERQAIAPELLGPLGTALEAGMGRIFWAIAAVAFAAWAVSFGFPRVAIAPRAARGAAAPETIAAEGGPP